MQPSTGAYPAPPLGRSPVPQSRFPVTFIISACILAAAPRGEADGKRPEVASSHWLYSHQTRQAACRLKMQWNLGSSPCAAAKLVQLMKGQPSSLGSSRRTPSRLPSLFHLPCRAGCHLRSRALMSRRAVVNGCDRSAPPKLDHHHPTTAVELNHR